MDTMGVRNTLSEPVSTALCMILPNGTCPERALNFTKGLRLSFNLQIAWPIFPVQFCGPLALPSNFSIEVNNFKISSHFDS